jgi:hypothetical protein
VWHNGPEYVKSQTEGFIRKMNSGPSAAVASAPAVYPPFPIQARMVALMFARSAMNLSFAISASTRSRLTWNGLRTNNRIT